MFQTLTSRSRSPTTTCNKSLLLLCRFLLSAVTVTVSPAEVDDYITQHPRCCRSLNDVLKVQQTGFKDDKTLMINCLIWRKHSPTGRLRPPSQDMTSKTNNTKTTLFNQEILYWVNVYTLTLLYINNTNATLLIMIVIQIY